MDKKTEQPNDTKKDDFESRHGEDLGVKKFAKLQAVYTFIPLLAMAAGGAAGYYALARPIGKLFPKLNKIAGVADVVTEKLGGVISDLNKKKTIQEIFSEYKPTPEQLEKLEEIWKKGSTLERTEQLKKSVEILNIKLPETPHGMRLGSAAGVGLIGGTVGGMAVGYDEWRKEESARLAAQEVNRDIANMELFRPSDPELLAENRRLSAMVAALPTIDTATVEKHGVVSEKQQTVSK